MEQSAESDRYTVSPAYIQRYQDVILPALYIGKPTVLDSTDNTSGLKTLVQRYIDGQITLDQFIREADGKLRMIQLENHFRCSSYHGFSIGVVQPATSSTFCSSRMFLMTYSSIVPISSLSVVRGLMNINSISMP